MLACLAAVAVARPQEFLSEGELEAIRDRDRNAEITSFDNQQTQDGGNIHSFTATNGIERQEEIQLKEVRVINEDGEEEFRLVPFYTGEFKYVPHLFVHRLRVIRLLKNSYSQTSRLSYIWFNDELH